MSKVVQQHHGKVRSGQDSVLHGMGRVTCSLKCHLSQDLSEGSEEISHRCQRKEHSHHGKGTKAGMCLHILRPNRQSKEGGASR